jgi:hypothetical protein
VPGLPASAFGGAVSQARSSRFFCRLFVIFIAFTVPCWIVNPAQGGTMRVSARRNCWFVLAIVTLLGASGAAFAQTTGATLLGTIVDEQGAVLPGAAITVTNTETGWNRVVVTNERGYYRAAALPPGKYEMKIEISGFRAEVRSGMTLTIGQEATINITLKLSNVQETITVTGESPIVETTKSTMGTTINRSQLDNLPIPGRDFTQLAQLTPGVTGVGGGGLNTGGQLSRNNTFLIDGVSNDEVALNTTRGSMSLETVREYVVMASQFAAEYGQASGAIVSVVTRSGTNRVEGRAFLFERDKSLAAQSFLLRDQGNLTKAPFSQQRYGGSLGGPIILDKLHYFGAYEGLRQREVSIVTVPSNILQAFGYNPNETTYPLKNDGNQPFFKIDAQLNQQQTLSVRYRFDQTKTIGSNIGGSNPKEMGYDYAYRNQDLGLSHTWIMSGRALNEARFVFSTELRWDTVDGYASSPNALSINRPSISLGKSNNMPQGDKARYLSFIDNFTYTIGSHNLKAGVSMIRLVDDAYFLGNKDGTFTFTTDLPFDPNNKATYPTQYQQNIGDWLDHELDQIYGGFIQDAWRLKPNFTLNLGLRYDVETAWSHANVMRVADASTNYAPVPQKVGNDYNNVQPRVGFAWDPWNNGKTAVRGGYGMYYDQTFLNITGNVSVSTKARGIIVKNPSYPDPFQSGSQSAPAPTATVAAPDIQVPSTRTLSIGVKREVIPGLAVSADFVNTRGMNLFWGHDVNWNSTTASRINPNWQTVTAYTTSGDSWSNALLVSVDRRASGHTPGFGIAYTLSKTTRNVEDFGSTPQDMNNLDADKSLASNDRRHQVVANITWMLPYDFQIGALMQARTGRPVNITTGQDNNGDGRTNDRPDLLVPGGNPFDKATYFAAFGAPYAQIGRVGNLPRNYAQGPGFLQFDLRVSKFIRFSGKRIEAFAEAFNLTNIRNNGNQASNLRSATFGKSTSLAGNARQVEFGFRFDF